MGKLQADYEEAEELVVSLTEEKKSLMKTNDEIIEKLDQNEMFQ